MSGAPETLKVFSEVIRVVLSDGVLTQEEKRLIITIGRELELDDGDPLDVYQAVLQGDEISGGRNMNRNERERLYTKAWETVHFNEDESKDEAAVMKCLREELHFSVEEASKLLEKKRQIKYSNNDEQKTLIEKIKAKLRR